MQLTTDGLGWHPLAVKNAFGWNGVDFAQIVKTYGVPLDETERQRRYRPMECTGAVEARVMGDPTWTSCPRSTSSGRTFPCGWGDAARHAPHE